MYLFLLLSFNFGPSCRRSSLEAVLLVDSFRVGGDIVLLAERCRVGATKEWLDDFTTTMLLVHNTSSEYFVDSGTT